jgi:hypothetical protein
VRLPIGAHAEANNVTLIIDTGRLVERPAAIGGNGGIEINDRSIGI